jgi:hypothetical protein
MYHSLLPSLQALAQKALFQSFEAATETVCNQTWCSYFSLFTYKTFQHAQQHNLAIQHTTWSSQNLPDSQKSYGGQYNPDLQQVPGPQFFALKVTLFSCHDIPYPVDRFRPKEKQSNYTLMTHTPTALFARKISPAHVPHTGFPPLTNSRSAGNCKRQMEVRFCKLYISKLARN